MDYNKPVPQHTFREDKQVRSSILTKLDRLIEGYPTITVAQHLKTLARGKGSSRDFINWTNKEFLSKLEKYMNELEDNPPIGGWGDKITNIIVDGE